MTLEEYRYHKAHKTLWWARYEMHRDCLRFTWEFRRALKLKHIAAWIWERLP